MSKKSDLKKDVNHLTFSVLNECYTFLDYSTELYYENVMDIIQDAVDLRNQLIIRINNTNQIKDSKEIRLKMRSIVDDMYHNNIDFIERLNSL